MRFLLSLLLLFLSTQVLAQNEELLLEKALYNLPDV